MIRESATVLRVQGSIIWVRCRNQAGCQRCAEGRGCGGGILGRLLGDRLREIKVVSDRMDLNVGDQVIIGLGDSVLLKSALVLYLMPLILMFAVAVLFSLISNAYEDLSSLVGAIVGLAIGLWLARGYGRRHHRDSLFHPRVLERTGRECPLDGLQRSS